MLLVTSFLFLICSIIFSNINGCDDQVLYTIRSAPSGFVLENNGTQVEIQYFDGYSNQLWMFQRASRPGLFFIVNNYTGNAIESPLNVTDVYVFLNAKDENSLYQQWFINSNGRITNAALNLNLDIVDALYVPGNPVGIWIDNDNDAQHFILQEKLFYN